MSKKVFYVAHPVSGDPLGNCDKVCAWIKWLTLNVPEHIFIAPWVAEVRAFADENALPEFYDRVLADDQEVVRHCDGILLVGGKVSRGMQLELDAARATNKLIINVAGWDRVPSGPLEDGAHAMVLRGRLLPGRIDTETPLCSQAGAPPATSKTLLTTDKTARKNQPVARGVLDYFPLAIAEIANVSFVGNQQHNPGEPMHWARGKSNDHADCVVRHLMERGTVDEDGLRHSAKAAWRALALLQEELEAAR